MKNCQNRLYSAIAWIAGGCPEARAQPIARRLFAVFTDESRPTEVREVSALAFGKIAEPMPDAVPTLLRYKHDPNPGIRAAVASALRAAAFKTTASGQATQVFIEMLEDRDEAVRQIAAAALYVYPTESAVASLCRLLSRDKNRVTRYEACRTLGRIGSRDALPAINAALRDREWLVSQQARYSLSKIMNPQKESQNEQVAEPTSGPKCQPADTKETKPRIRLKLRNENLPDDGKEKGG